MANPVVHFEIVAKDPKKMQKFYSELFGWKINADNPMGYGLIEKGAEHGIAGGIAGAQAGAPAGLMVYAEVDDVQKYLDKAVKLGNKVLMPVTVIPDMVTLAIFQDSGGTAFGLVKSGIHGAAAKKAPTKTASAKTKAGKKK